MNSVTYVQSAVNAKALVVPSLAWVWGFEDGAGQQSAFSGYDYFAGAHLADYQAGYQAAQQLIQLLGALGLAPVRQYIPFQAPASAYADCQPLDQRPEYIGA